MRILLCLISICILFTPFLVIASTATSDGQHIQKMSIVYSGRLQYTDTQNFVAAHFDLLDTSRNYGTPVNNIKAMNPNILIISYYDALVSVNTMSDWNIVNSHEDWFVHDIYGNRIESANYNGNFLMDPSSGWSDYYAERALATLQDYPLYDGVFVDDCSYDMIELGYEWSVPYSDFEDGALTNWGTRTLQLIQNLHNTIGDEHMAMTNAWKYMQFPDITHCTLWENFIHGRSSAWNSPGYSPSYSLLAIDLLHNQAAKGNTIAVNSGCSNANDHPTAAKKWMIFTLACFLFAVEDMNKAYYSWQFYGQEDSNGWYPEMDTTFGSPVGSYYNAFNQVYAREFTNYIVVANLSPTDAENITINSENYELPPRTAIFVENENAGAPSVSIFIEDWTILGVGAISIVSIVAMVIRRRV